MAPNPVFLALGSNLGDREATLAAAVAALRGVRAVRASSLYETEPVGGPPQDDYLNQVVAGETALDPGELLSACQAVEARFGRERRSRNAPRTLDIDILFYGDVVSESRQLTLPHPRLHERRFVLVPLAEIAPDFVHPRLRRSVRELLARCEDRSRVLPHAGVGAAG
jgi:2-amino-4-hydroxy-6-hydroxymethyldihydropteridine diphosphokinase